MSCSSKLNPRRGLLEVLIDSWWVGSTGDNLVLPVGVSGGGGAILWDLMLPLPKQCQNWVKL